MSRLGRSRLRLHHGEAQQVVAALQHPEVFEELVHTLAATSASGLSAAVVEAKRVLGTVSAKLLEYTTADAGSDRGALRSNTAFWKVDFEPQ